MAGPLLAMGERARAFLVVFLWYWSILVVFDSFPMILVVFLWFSHVSGRSGGRANGRTGEPTPPEHKPDGLSNDASASGLVCRTAWGGHLGAFGFLPFQLFLLGFSFWVRVFLGCHNCRLQGVERDGIFELIFRLGRVWLKSQVADTGGGVRGPEALKVRVCRHHLAHVCILRLLRSFARSSAHRAHAFSRTQFVTHRSPAMGPKKIVINTERVCIGTMHSSASLSSLSGPSAGGPQ